MKNQKAPKQNKKPLSSIIIWILVFVGVVTLVAILPGDNSKITTSSTTTGSSSSAGSNPGSSSGSSSDSGSSSTGSSSTGSSDTSGSSSSGSSCYPMSDEGTCYEPGEYCRDSDEGTTGLAGDGESITCENNDGLRWEPN